jgi:hypothetical protein
MGDESHAGPRDLVGEDPFAGFESDLNYWEVTNETAMLAFDDEAFARRPPTSVHRVRRAVRSAARGSLGSVRYGRGTGPTALGHSGQV